MTAPSAVPALNAGSLVSVTLYAPTGQKLRLSETEQRILNALSTKLLDVNYQSDLELSRLYAEGMNTVTSLGIAIPPELEPLRAVMGWCGTALAARSERLTLQGFRMPGSTTIDEELQIIWQDSNLDAESTLVHDDAMTYRHSFVIVGVQANSNIPLTTVESPKCMTASWDARRREVSAAYQTYIDVDPASETYLRQLATLYTRDATIHMISGPQGWEVQERNDHGMGFVPVLMFPNNPTSTNRYGTSEIAPAWRNTQDRAARGVARNEVAAEFFAAMKLWLLGVKASDLRRPDGTPATAFETFTGRLSTLEADQNGVLPEVFVQQGQDPTGMIKFIDHQASIFSSHAAVPLDYLGIVSDGNPTAADAITKGDFRLMKRAERLITQFGNGWEDWARMVLRVRDKGQPPKGLERLESDWSKPTIPTPNADAVTVTTQIAAGMIAPDDDDALAACGWSAVQRQRIARNRDRYQGEMTDRQLIPGLRQQSRPQQSLDGEQPLALNRLQQQRDGVVTGS